MACNNSVRRSRLAAAFAFLMCFENAIHCGPASADEQGGIENNSTAGDTRMVWVLTEQAGASEGGRVSSESSAIVPYELQCALGQLRGVRRNMAGLGVYGSAKWTIRVNDALSSPEGARRLRQALEGICKM